MVEKAFLGFNVLVWMGYGAYCFFVPGALEGGAGIVAQSPTGTTELRAMYGGLQFGLGELCLYALIRPDFTRHALLAIAFTTSGLFTARFAGILLDGSGSQYTGGALGFELLCLVGAWWLFARKPQAAAR